MHHVACRQLPFHGKGRQVVKDYAKIFTSNRARLVGMKTCKLAELVAWDAWKVCKVCKLTRKHFCPDTHFRIMHVHELYI